MVVTFAGDFHRAAPGPAPGVVYCTARRTRDDATRGEHAMKRWLVFLLIGLAVLVMLSPGIVGRIAERSIERQLELATERDPAASVSTERFRRGWFTSEGRHRVPLNDPALVMLAAFLGAAEPGDVEALIVTTRLDHGLVPVGGASRDVAALLPALARGVSTLEVEMADGTLRALPGELESAVGLTGGATLLYTVPPGNARQSGVLAEWQDLSVTLTSSADGRELGFDASFDGLALQEGRQQLEFDDLQVDVATALTSYGFATGDARVALGRGSLEQDGERFAWDAVNVDASSAENGGRVRANLSVRVAGLETGTGRFAGTIDAAAQDVDAARLAPVLRRFQRSGDATVAGLDRDTLLRHLLAGGGRLAIPALSVDTPQGTLEAALEVALRATDGVASWPGLALGAQATAELAVPRELAAPGGLLAEPLRPLVAGGFLKPDGAVYRLDAKLARGVATINGAPLPIPMLLGEDAPR